MKWNDKEIKLYSKESRTLGAPLNTGQQLHKDLQRIYILKESTEIHGNGIAGTSEEDDENEILHDINHERSKLLIEPSPSHLPNNDFKSSQYSYANPENIENEAPSSAIDQTNYDEDSDGYA